MLDLINIWYVNRFIGSTSFTEYTDDFTFFQMKMKIKVLIVFYLPGVGFGAQEIKCAYDISSRRNLFVFFLLWNCVYEVARNNNSNLNYSSIHTLVYAHLRNTADGFPSSSDYEIRKYRFLSFCLRSSSSHLFEYISVLFTQPSQSRAASSRLYLLKNIIYWPRQTILIRDTDWVIL